MGGTKYHGLGPGSSRPRVAFRCGPGPGVKTFSSSAQCFHLTCPNGFVAPWRKAAAANTAWPEAAHRMPGMKRCVPRWPSASRRSFTTDHRAIDDRQVDVMPEHFAEPELVALIAFMGFMRAGGTFAKVFDVVAETD